jgi:hypothetical protein
MKAATEEEVDEMEIDCADGDYRLQLQLRRGGMVTM